MFTISSINQPPYRKPGPVHQRRNRAAPAAACVGPRCGRPAQKIREQDPLHLKQRGPGRAPARPAPSSEKTTPCTRSATHRRQTPPCEIRQQNPMHQNAVPARVSPHAPESRRKRNETTMRLPAPEAPRPQAGQHARPPDATMRNPPTEPHAPERRPGVRLSPCAKFSAETRRDDRETDRPLVSISPAQSHGIPNETRERQHCRDPTLPLSPNAASFRPRP